MADLDIEKIVIDEHTSVSCCPARGGMITSLVLAGKELLYFDQERFIDVSKSARGGIVVLFPNAGPVDVRFEKDFPQLRQHGFARDCVWQFEITSRGFREVFSSDERTRKIFPFDFTVSLEVTFELDGSCRISQTVQNATSGKAMPLAIGLHPYFKVPNGEKKNITFNFVSGAIFKANESLWMNDVFVVADAPRGIATVDIPLVGSLSFETSSEFEKLWVWAVPDKDFVCIEPMMRDAGGLIDNPRMLIPGEACVATLHLSFM